MRAALALTLLSAAACGPNARGDRDGGGPGECPPGGRACVGDDVVECDADGDPGDVVERCGAGESCIDGACRNGCAATGAELVYVVDNDNRLLSFDPTRLPEDPFTVLGTLTCPAGPPLEGTGASTPFSMAIDRNAVAWILYSSGEIFHVPVDTLVCTNSGYTVGQAGLSLFGMGFMTDAAGGDTEKLYIVGSETPGTPGGNLAVVEPSTLAVTVRGTVRGDTEYSPELTGTGAAELFAFYPGVSEAFVQELDPTSGAAVGGEFAVPGGLAGGNIFAVVQAWAFAQHSGLFYLFTTVGDAVSGGSESTVRRIDPTNGQETVVRANSPYRIVGAGVSTCAPVVLE